MREHQAAGFEHLELVTALLQSARVANPGGGVWEAADLQWWWRKDQHPDPQASTFWLDDDDRPVAAIVFTDWGDNIGCDVLHARHDSAAALEIVGPRLLRLLDAYANQPVEMLIRSDDRALLDAATTLGLVAIGDGDVTTTMAAFARPAVSTPPAGFVVSSYAERSDRPHHFVARNGEHVARRLREASLYRPDLDLCVVDTATDAVAAYCLFWADPVTRVGLVEPMRTEDAYQGLGLGKVVLRNGLERLAAAGSEQLRVTYHLGNEPAMRLYLGAGFRAWGECRTYRREPR
jgi:RimJ/RimL family protein N-acetyltransferase